MNTIIQQANAQYEKDLQSLIEAIEDLDLKRNVIAEQVGIGRTTFYNYLCGKTTMPHDIYVILVKMLDNEKASRK